MNRQNHGIIMKVTSPLLRCFLNVLTLQFGSLFERKWNIFCRTIDDALGRGKVDWPIHFGSSQPSNFLSPPTHSRIDGGGNKQGWSLNGRLDTFYQRFGKGSILQLGGRVLSLSHPKHDQFRHAVGMVAGCLGSKGPVCAVCMRIVA